MKRGGGWEKQKERNVTKMLYQLIPQLHLFQSSSHLQEESALSDNGDNAIVDEITTFPKRI